MNSYSTQWKQVALFIVFSLSSSVQSFATETVKMSIEDIIAKAVSHSKIVKLSHYDRQISISAIQQKRIDMLPTINVNGSASYASNMNIYDKGIFRESSQHDVIHYLYTSNVDFYFNLYNGNRDKMNIKSAQLEERLAHVNWLESISLIKMQVCNLYLDLQQNYSQLEVIKQDIVDQKQQLIKIKAMHNAGTVLSSDVLRIEVELSKRELILSRIKNDIQFINNRIQYITGIIDDIEPINTITDKVLLSYEQVINDAKQHSYILQKSELELVSKKLSIQQAKSNYLPELSLTSNFTFANPQIFLYPYNDSWYNLTIVGIKLNMPISALYKNKYNVHAANLAYEKEKVKHHHEEEELESALFRAYLDLKLALEEREVRAHNIELAKENARIVKNRYFANSALVTELLDVDTQFLQTHFEYQAAIYAIQKQYYFIESLKGTL